MKLVILAGGLGTRLSEETEVLPKPIVQIGGKPILWHIMKIYAHFGVSEFIICLGYKGYLIKEYFANYYLHTADVTIDTSDNTMEVHRANAENWRITLIDTGIHTMTGGRLRRVAEFVAEDECFAFTYGDGVANIDIQAELNFHQAHGCLATVAGVNPPGRFGVLDISDDNVVGFREKVVADDNWINGGFFILSPKVIGFIKDDDTIWEQEPLGNLAKLGQLKVYKHHGYWQPMDMLREKRILNQLWDTGAAPWKMWD